MYAFSSFFLQFLDKRGYDSVRGWTNKVVISAYDILLVPVFLTDHWCVAKIDLRMKQITFMDSMGSHNTECPAKLLRYIRCEMKDVNYSWN